MLRSDEKFSSPAVVPCLTPDQVIDLIAFLTDDELTDLMSVVVPVQENPVAYCAAVTDWFQHRQKGAVS